MNDLIFVVEDTDEDVEAIERAISRSHPHLHPEFFRSGTEVLARLAEPGGRRPWLMLLDLNMPGEDGLEVIRRLRGDSGLDDLTIVVFSSSEDEAETDACHAAGADSYIFKPLNFALFQSVLSRTLDYWRGRPRSGNVARTVVPPPGESSAHT
ncbi:response regulator [Actinoplanes sp. NPDC023801]|uniref:response regulator n=1 Tax=Actinoplanes sp. NPDC023801 TaxID=3154595 RepID=UPI0033FD7175